jgi:hypothetical protein
MSMAVRYCPRCDAEVEDLGGYCMLGHSMKLTPITELVELRDLKAEVDKAFADAELEVASVIASVTGEMEAVASGPAPSTVGPALQKPPPPPPPPPERFEVFEDVDEAAKERYASFWKTIDEDPEPSASDPITAFAPSPRMDWGPEGKPAKRRRR